MSKDKQKNKKRTIIISLSIFFVLYVLLALKPLGTELHMTPDWTCDISRTQKPTEGDVYIPYRLGRNIGYFTPEGKLISDVIFPFQAAIDQNYYSIYNENNTKTEIYTKTGELTCTIEQAGFPFFEDGRIYIFYPGGSSLARYDIEGNKIWEYQGYAPITAFDSGMAATAIGLADGTIVSIDNEGNIDQQFSPGGSAVEIIMGLAISEDGQLIGAIAGQNNQRFVVARKDGEHSKILFHEYLPADFKQQVCVKFSKNTDTVYYNYKGGIGIVDLNKLKSAHIPVDGIVTHMEEVESPHLMFVLSHDDATHTVTVIEPFNNKIGSFKFEADYSFLKVYDNGVFIGRNNKISKLLITRR